jgi:uncharacterized damage-inducible protein DinB
MAIDPGYEAPRGLPPLLRGLLTTCHERHVDMLNLVAGLPDDALNWRPIPDSASLAGLALHILDVEDYLAALARGEDREWTGENGSRMDEFATADAVSAAIEAVDASLKAALESVTLARLERVEPQQAGAERSIGEALVEDLDHSAMHYGHMQLTRHAWEAAHPEAPATYEHWR